MSAPHHGIEPPAGMAREVGLLFAELEECRRDTREAVAGMATEHLDARLPGVPDSIAVNLLHVAAAELWWIRKVVLGEELPAALMAEFAAARLGSKESREYRGHELAYHLGKLDEVRARTEAACWNLREDDLDTERDNPIDGSRCTVRWILHHLVDHEAHHRGRIGLLKRLVHAG